MIKRLNVGIAIKDTEKGVYYSFPVLPSTIQYTNGDTLTHSLTVVDLGTVEVPNGRDVDSFTFTSEFPARYDAGYFVIGPAIAKKPMEYKTALEDLKEREVVVQLIIPVLGINKAMYIASFNPEFKGFEGDIGFSISFREYRVARPQKLRTGGTAPPKGKKSPAARPAAAAKAIPKTYTVKSGDTLTGIAKKLGIKDWRARIYEPNKKLIGTNPNNLKVGQVLKL